MFVRRGLLLVIGCVALAGGVAGGFAAERLRFWNLTTVTIEHLYLAPAGTTAWSANQCKNDPDGTVDPDERLRLTGIEPGRYDVSWWTRRGEPARCRTWKSWPVVLTLFRFRIVTSRTARNDRSVTGDSPPTIA